ncbi:hypothetical protein RFM99_24505 [Mesorhizobium sp. VK4C]|uniref:hypothetical protein n=1 Tax=Mesorhizobium captivum TaxID=3072319 RepID=UPI002A239AEA|nr:hypothetical protein [Mesorhizobium sp. VK4C]MDX8501564.1 hypothetical protein [Mesorhizobium sp. VK4C]
MAIRFSAKDQPAGKPAKPSAAVRPGQLAAAPKADGPVATDLFETSAEASPRKTGKKK